MALFSEMMDEAGNLRNEIFRLKKALQDIRFIAEDPIGLDERKKIQKICNRSLDHVGARATTNKGDEHGR